MVVHGLAATPEPRHWRVHTPALLLMSIPQHSSVSNEHYTPIEIVEAAREVMGGIDLDPATTALVNQRIKAKTFYTKEDDGFSKPWAGRTFLNPPGGKIGNKSNAALWWDKLVREYFLGTGVTQAFFVGFTLEIMATSQDSPAWIGNFPFCIPRKRIAFDKELGDELVVGDSPPHANVLVYLPAYNENRTPEFVELFSKFGQCVVPEHWLELPQAA